jgi:hypothetical protein
MLEREGRMEPFLPSVQPLDVLEGISLTPTEQQLWAIGVHWSREIGIGVFA